MILAYIAEVGFIMEKTSIGAQKINGLSVETNDMGLTRFSF